MRVILICLLNSLLFFQFISSAHAQEPSPVVSLTQVPAEGLLLKDGWRFQAGDIPDGASPQLNDQQWASIDPTQDIRDLPQLREAGIGWLRLHLTTSDSLPPIMVSVFQSVASEIYLDGRLLYSFGTISTHPDKVIAYNPNEAFVLPLRSSSQHVLAVRIAYQPGLDLDKSFLRWDSSALQLSLFPTEALPAHRPLALQSAYLDTFKIGICFILFILHLSLFIAYREKRANLYAASLYLILGITHIAKATYGLGHPMHARMLIHFVSLIDVWASVVIILTFYSLFNFRKDWFFWLAVGCTVIRTFPQSLDYSWLHSLITYYLQIVLIRIAIVATQRKLQGASIVRVGVICTLVIWLAVLAISALGVPFGGNEWLFHLVYLSAFLCIPLTLSLRLALEHGWVNRQLVVKLQEVENLSARNAAQQHERQELLAKQNEQLEQQVAERTAVLHQQADQLRELDQLKSRFVTNLTHEFRTPLSLIISPVEKLLQENRFDRPILTLVQRNADRLLQLINQLLDLSKLENNFMAVSLMQGKVTQFVHHIVVGFQRHAEQKDVTLSCEMAQFPLQNHAFDADKWEKILTNLLSNAIKFTPSGGEVTLTIIPVRATGEITGVHIQLTDSGIGISEEQLPHIFDRFYQADPSPTRTYEGTGIGLALVRELVDLLGGTIMVESKLNVGTTFNLMLPVESVSPTAGVPSINWPEPKLSTSVSPATPAPGPAVNGLAEGETSAFRILVVEDNDELREFLVGELGSSYHVIEAVNGERGWGLIQTELPDIVLTDVMMPQMDGYELTRLIKTNPDTDHIAVVMLTAKSAHQSRLDGLQTGADDYLPKPFSLVELQLRLNNLVTRQQRLAHQYRQRFALPNSEPEANVAADTMPDQSADLELTISDPFLQRIYELLEANLDNPALNVEWLTTQLKINRKTLYRKVYSLTQLAPADLIRRYKLRKAAELLQRGYTVSATADLVGFNSQARFSISFKDFYQQTPTEFIGNRRKRN